MTTESIARPVQWAPSRITNIRTYQHPIPLPQPLRTAIHIIPSVENVLVEIECDGLVGSGYAFCFRPGEAAAIRTMVEDLAESLVGTDPSAVRSSWQLMWKQINTIGQSGVGVLAVSALDTALWDLHAQRAGLPLFRMLGGSQTRLPVYATGGWTSQPVEQVIEDGLRHRDDGFRYFKIKVGSESWRTDVDRLEKLKSAVGDSMEILVDANQRWSVHDAITAGRAFSDCGVYWFEEPIAADDVAGSAAVTAAVDVPLATGETVYAIAGFKPLIEARGADILMPDLMRCGGPTGFLQVTQLAAAHNLPCSSHCFTEVSAHLMSLSPNGIPIESIPGWWDTMFDEAPRVVNGEIVLTDRPGLGITFSDRVRSETR